MEKLRQEWKEKQKELKKEKGETMKLKDFHRKMLLENGGIVDDDEDDEDGKKPVKVKTFAEEQEELKKSFLNAVDGIDNDAADNEDGFFSLKKKTEEELQAEEQDYKNFLLQSIGKTDKHALHALEEWKNHEDNANMDDKEKFLIDFVLNRKWMDTPNNTSQNWMADPVALSEDEEAVEKMEEFEREHNFRFEEQEGAQIVTHAREIPGALRRKDTRRKEARDRRKERKEAERQEKMEELKRLKNLKRNEIWDKLQKIREITGNENVGFDDIDLSKPFDPKEWDSKMNSIFNDKYYDAEDPEMKADPEEGVDLVKPVWKDDIDISDIVKEDPEDAEEEDDDANGAGQSAGGANNKKKLKNRKKKEKRKQRQTAMELLKAAQQFDDEEAYAPLPENQDDDGSAPQQQQQHYAQEDAYYDENGEIIMDADYLEGNADPSTIAAGTGIAGNKKLSKREQKRLEKEMRKKIKNFDDYLNEYYQLDYEDMVGDLPTRFKYTTVPKEDFGLSPVEILLADDKDLNEFYSLKKMAPYRNNEVVSRDKKRWKKTKKQKLMEFRKKLSTRAKEFGFAVETLKSSKSSNHANGDAERNDKKKKKKEKKKSSDDKEGGEQTQLDNPKKRKHEGDTADVAEHDPSSASKKEKKKKQKKNKSTSESFDVAIEA